MIWPSSRFVSLALSIVCCLCTDADSRGGVSVCVVASLPVKYGPNLGIVRPVYSITMCYYNVITQLHCYYSALSSFLILLAVEIKVRLYSSFSFATVFLEIETSFWNDWYS